MRPEMESLGGDSGGQESAGADPRIPKHAEKALDSSLESGADGGYPAGGGSSGTFDDLVTLRRRVNWPLILDGDQPLPEIMAPAPAVDPLLSAFDELLAIEDGDRLLKRAVELALERVGLVRAGLFLLADDGNSMLGTWGTDLEGNIVDERHVMYLLGDYDREVFRRAAENGVPFTVIENSPIVVQLESVTRVAGRGWLACTPVRSVRGNLGMMFNDAGSSGALVDEAKQARAALFCSLVGTVLDLRKTSSTLSVDRTPSPVPPSLQTQPRKPACQRISADSRKFGSPSSSSTFQDCHARSPAK